MRHEEFHYNKETKKWEKTIVEDDGGFVFSTTADFPIERLKEEKKKSLKAGKKQGKQKP